MEHTITLGSKISMISDNLNIHHNLIFVIAVSKDVPQLHRTLNTNIMQTYLKLIDALCES